MWSSKVYAALAMALGTTRVQMIHHSQFLNHLSNEMYALECPVVQKYSAQNPI